MSAEVVAGELGLDLYVVDLATVVDKYIGETEKNLDRIFDAAAGVNGVLLFDEADAVFGKRSEVKDAHDRYANVESAYLLQRMESFDGLAILATNLRANIDEAFTRRLDVIVEFPVPDAAQRLVLWRQLSAATLPQSESLDLEFCAESFELERWRNPFGRSHRRLPRRELRVPRHDGAGGDGRAAGVPQARPAVRRTGVRPLSLDAVVTAPMGRMLCPKGGSVSRSPSHAGWRIVK